jgi:hypothetical protein
MRQEDSSFLKKRSKKLLSVCRRHCGQPHGAAARIKSLFASFSAENEES